MEQRRDQTIELQGKLLGAGFARLTGPVSPAMQSGDGSLLLKNEGLWV